MDNQQGLFAATDRKGLVRTPADTRHTSWIRDRNDPATDTVVYIGTGHPSELNTTTFPLFLSATTLNRYRTRGEDFPVGMNCAWAGDSGAYTALTGKNPDHPWHLDPDEYGGMWTRLTMDIGPADFIAPQDLPCEPKARERTGMTAREHAYWTVENYLYLAEQFPFLPWIPVLQGWEPEDYEYCASLYEQAGVDLYDGRLVGLGSICRRGSDKDIAALVEKFARRGMRLHGFGVSIKGLRRIGHLLASTDSQAWSDTARKERIRLDGCTHMSKPDPRNFGRRRETDCRNCMRYAAHYREEMFDAIRFSAAKDPRRRRRDLALAA